MSNTLAWKDKVVEKEEREIKKLEKILEKEKQLAKERNEKVKLMETKEVEH